MKVSKYRKEMDAMGMKMVPVVFEVGGASGDGVTELLRMIVGEETARPGLESPARRMYAHRVRLAHVLQRHNARILLAEAAMRRARAVGGRRH